MPAALDVDREQVKMLALSVGVREAARKLGLHEDTVKQWSKRGKWLAQPEKIPLPPTVLSNVTTVTKPAQVLQDALAEDSKQTKIHLSRYARKTSEHASKLKGSKALKVARSVKDVAGIADTVHGWSGDRDRGLQVNILSIGGNTQIGI